MPNTVHDANIINTERTRQAEEFRLKLEKMGVGTTIQHFSGDSSYPTEYTLKTNIGKLEISGMGPTFDIALMNLVHELLYNLKKED